MNRLLLTLLLAIATLWTLPAHAALQYEESLKQLAKGVIADIAEMKRGRVETENNREGLCIHDTEIPPRRKGRTLLTFSAPTDATGSQFIFRYHEKAPRPDALFSIEGLKADSAGAPPAATNAIPPPSN